jgi:hypothetical protein
MNNLSKNCQPEIGHNNFFDNNKMLKNCEYSLKSKRKNPENISIEPAAASYHFENNIKSATVSISHQQ